MERGPEGMLTVEQVAAAVGRSRAIVRRHAADGKLPGAVLIGLGNRGTWLIPARYADPAVYAQTIPPAHRPRRRDDTPESREP